ncbi:MAG: hypothetical protein CFE23_14425 [Flavobacterium sp. BFFFF1]|uniref:hypothetical protein n=1 Tax=unclassified Flavobacterium TaxID=196869 RepID=UPI000BDD12ED|nr:MULTISPECIES: hypothetical protein [unclassified Flavobacterium]OYU79361.1 MAG: hypothetical protein CFE23_14425 [Flavobacterium sp. BFFFF1]
MKTLSIILFTVAISTNLFGQTDLDKFIDVTISLDKSYVTLVAKKDLLYYIAKESCISVTKDSVNVRYFDIKVNIVNTTSKAIYVWMYTCSWYDNFQINNNYILFSKFTCDHNYLKKEEIKAGEKLEYSLTLMKSIKFDYPGNCRFGEQIKTTKLGFIVFDDIFSSNGSSSMDDKSLWKIIWSNQLNLLDVH